MVCGGSTLATEKTVGGGRRDRPQSLSADPGARSCAGLPVALAMAVVAPMTSSDTRRERRSVTEWWQDAARVSMLTQMLPDWAERGACAEQAPNRAPLAIMFDDDPAHQPKGPDAYTWPAGVLQAMKMCAGCP